MNALKNELTRLRGASNIQLSQYGKDLATKRVAWYKTHAEAALEVEGDLLEKAYRLLLRKLKIKEHDAPILKRTRKELVFCSKNYCPTLEACKILGLDTRKVCKLYNEKATDALVKQIDSNLEIL